MQRLDYYSASPAGMQALMSLEIAVSRLSLEPSLVFLIKLRASQISGCALCVDLHSNEARVGGESSRRLDAVAEWRTAGCFSLRERAALAWTESLALLPSSHAPDPHYALLSAHFNPDEQASLTLAIGLALTWNYIGVGFRNTPVQ
jgi:AhpD family alkylhydroperoxidase